jgi:VanZ family protein
MVVVYVGTTLLNGADPAPCCGIERLLFELRHVLTHLVTFGFEVWLLSRAVGLPGSRRIARDPAILIAVGLALGLGQETLQTLLRHNLALLDSLWDLAVDLGGSALGWWLYNRRAHLRPVGVE